MPCAAFSWDTLYYGNRLSDGLACELALPPPVLTGKNQTGMAASFEFHELSRIQSGAFSWGIQVSNACVHHRPKPLPEEGIDQSHNSPASWAEPTGAEVVSATNGRLEQQRHVFNGVSRH